MGIRKHNIIYEIYLDSKKRIYREFFNRFGVRQRYTLINGEILSKFRKKVIGNMQYAQSACNAGILDDKERYITIVKNQTFSHCAEMGINSKLHNNLYKERDLKRLYRIDFDSGWNIIKQEKVQAKIDSTVIGDEDGLEDARLFRYRDEIWVYATVNGHRKNCWPCLGKLIGSGVDLSRPKYAVSSPQKNWMPFEMESRIYLEYSINPHVVLSYEPDTSECELAGETSFHGDFSGLELHGGAPAIRYDKDTFLGVANTQERFWYQERYYAVMFYLFQANAPFRITHITKPLRIGSYKERIRYVIGLVVSRDRSTLILSIGISDCDNYIVAVKMSDIENELSPVTTSEA